MIGNNLVGAQYANEAGAKQMVATGYTRTIGENIDAQIKQLQGEIDRLCAVRAQLESGTSLLNVRLEDLSRAMRY